MKKILSLLLACILLGGLFPGRAEEPDPLQAFAIRSGRRDEKKIAITVDDSFNLDWTWKVRDMFQEYGIIGTFFPIGIRVLPEDGPEWQKILDNGNEIGSHSYGHIKLGQMSIRSIISQLGKFQEALDAALGYHYQVLAFRPPFGDMETETGDTKPFRTAVHKFGLEHVVLWDVSQTEVKKAYSRVKNGSILLFHARKKDYDCMKELIPMLLEDGYEFVTISELLEFGEREISPDPYVYSWDDYAEK